MHPTPQEGSGAWSEHHEGQRRGPGEVTLAAIRGEGSRVPAGPAPLRPSSWNPNTRGHLSSLTQAASPASVSQL